MNRVYCLYRLKLPCGRNAAETRDLDFSFSIRLPRASGISCVAFSSAVDTLAKKKSKKKYSVGKEARRRARERAGLPPTERVIPDKRRKPPKHKKQVIEQELY